MFDSRQGLYPRVPRNVARERLVNRPVRRPTHHGRLARARITQQHQRHIVGRQAHVRVDLDREHFSKSNYSKFDD